MTIFLKKFGTLLNGRMSGKEALSAFRPSLKEIKKNETVEVDFAGVDVFTPSWGDEFLSPLQREFKKQLILKNTGNPSVQATLNLLENTNKEKFIVDKK